MAGRRALVAALQQAGLWHCQIGVVLTRALYADDQVNLLLSDAACQGEPTGLHERRKRSAQGSTTLLANLMPACSFHNGWVEDHPNLAYRLGLTVREGDREWFMLGRDRGGF